MKIVGVIPVRSGSERVENKNIRPFANSSILEIKIEQLKRIPILKEIIVNSNDDRMLLIAKKHGCTTVKRDLKYASNSIPMAEVYKNIAVNCDSDIILYTNATNPLVSDKTIIDAINMFISQNNFDSLNTAHEIKEFLFHQNKPYNFDLNNFPRSQDLPDIYALNFAVNIISRENMINYKHIVGKKPLVYLIDQIEGVDIDNPIDFDFAEYVYKKKIKEIL